jgi:hypothetical protein
MPDSPFSVLCTLKFNRQPFGKTLPRTRDAQSLVRGVFAGAICRIMCMMAGANTSSQPVNRPDDNSPDSSMLM